jgi:hypothetical protein
MIKFALNDELLDTVRGAMLSRRVRIGFSHGKTMNPDYDRIHEQIDQFDPFGQNDLKELITCRRRACRT